MEFTEISNEDGVVTIELTGRGFDARATVTIGTGTWPLYNIPDCVAPTIDVRFVGTVTINGKDYEPWRCSSMFHPYAHGQNEREVLTDKGVQVLPYMASAGGYHRELTDSARTKLRELATAVADKYLTTEASKAALINAAIYKIADARIEKEKAEAAVRDRVAELDSARAYLAQMEQL